MDNNMKNVYENLSREEPKKITATLIASISVAISLYLKSLDEDKVTEEQVQKEYYLRSYMLALKVGDKENIVKYRKIIRSSCTGNFQMHSIAWFKSNFSTLQRLAYKPSFITNDDIKFLMV